MKCIYCGTEETFNTEHIVPQSLGTFAPVNPTILPSDGLVCEHCNSVVFSALETEFKEDSYEGITGQMLNLTGSNSVRIRSINVQMECLSGMDDSFFNEVFPFLKEQNKKLVIDVKPQVKVRNYAGQSGYQIFSLEALEKIKEESTQSKTKLDAFNKIKKRLKMSGKDNLAVFTRSDDHHDDSQLNYAIALLGAYGVAYNERERKYAPMPQDDGKQFEVKMQCTITRNVCRFVAKVAFNYFAYCALQDKEQSVLYQSAFDRIRKFVLGDETFQMKEIIVETSNDPITWHEKESGNRFVGHTIVFYQENGLVFSKLTFFGGKVYKVLLGNAMNNFLDNNFGCGHLFFPFDHSIHNLTQRPKEKPSEDEIKKSFGLFRRIDLSSK